MAPPKHPTSKTTSPTATVFDSDLPAAGPATPPATLASADSKSGFDVPPDSSFEHRDTHDGHDTLASAESPLPHQSTAAHHQLHSNFAPQTLSAKQAPSPSRTVPAAADADDTELLQHASALQSPSQHAHNLWSNDGLAEPDTTSDLELRDFAMLKKKKSFRLGRRPSSRHGSSPYGSVNQTPNRSASPSASESTIDDVHLHNVRDSSRSEASRRSLVSRSSSRVSEDLDGAVLASGMEGRFGLAETPLLETVIDNGKADELDGDEEGAYVYEPETSSDGEEEEPENSPNDAVRASVSPTDDTTLSINTPRMWCLSVLFSILGSSTNLFFSLRYPSVAITPVIALLLVHPLGLLWDVLLKRSYDPQDTFIDGVRSFVDQNEHEPPSRHTKTLRTWRQWFAQGRWNEKEHTCVYVSSNVAFGFAFATDVIVEQTQFYNQKAPIMYQLLLTISTQILGYGFAGMARRFLVRPSGMIWPSTLMSAAMFSTLHKQENKPANGWTISRWNFFYVVWTAAFLFYFLPGLLMPALSYFNVITWFAPNSVVIANLFGVTSGLGLFPLTFDWAQITYVGSPLLVPFWAAVNVVGGLVIVMWIIAPILYYSNVLYTSFMPMLSAAVFDNTGKVYDVSKILTPDFLFDREAYQNYSRVFLPVAYMLSYGVQFAGLASLLTHTFCWHGRDIWQTWKKALAEAREDGKPAYQRVNEDPDEEGSPTPPLSRTTSAGRMSASQSQSNLDNLLSREDIHSRLMKRYKDAPLSWYLITFISMTCIGIFLVE